MRCGRLGCAIWDDVAAVDATNLVDAEQFHQSAIPDPPGRPRATASMAAEWMTTSTASAVLWWLLARG